MNFELLTTVHTALSFIAMALGIPAVWRLFKPSIFCLWTKLFLIAAVATTGTGFLFPISVMTPALATGIIATLVFVVLFLARRVFHLAGAWRWIYALSMVASLYLLVFVAIAQAFLKIPVLQDLAPTLSEPPFALSQIAVLSLFAYIGIKAARAYRGGQAQI